MSVFTQGYERGTWRIGGWLEGQGSAQEGLECNWGFKRPQWQRCKCAPGRAAGAHGTNGHYWRLVLAGQDLTVMHFEPTYPFPSICRCKTSDFMVKAAAVARAEKRGMGTGMAGQVPGEAAPGGGGTELMSGLGGQGLMR